MSAITTHVRRSPPQATASSFWKSCKTCSSVPPAHTHTPAGPASSNRLARRPRWARENSRPISPRLLAAPERPRALAPPIARKCRRGVGPIQLALRVTDVGGRARLERANVCTPPHGFPALCSQSSPPSREDGVRVGQSPIPPVPGACRHRALMHICICMIFTVGRQLCVRLRMRRVIGLTSLSESARMLVCEMDCRGAPAVACFV
ncbi:hypothetical protein C8Q76DRAFT_437752 [Earliella scabrosa]|nr:hypothetical protein C8Q76DRAFT_437752 [Earliella scabrosa]